MKHTFKVGDKVEVTPELNPHWAGTGVVCTVWPGAPSVCVEMTSGKAQGNRGAFDIDQLVPLTFTMTILKIKRSIQDTEVKIYGRLLSDSGKEYNFAYIRRRPGFRGWICSCESFFFNGFTKRQGCKHLHFVRQQVGRYGAKVPKTA